MSSCLENKFQSFIGLLGISSSVRISTSLNWAELKELWRAYQRSSSSIHGCPLYWIALIARSLYFLIQFISFYKLHFLFTISLIFSSKKDYFEFLTIFLKLHQFLRLRECQYLSRESWQLLFHHTLECFVILTVFECLCHNSSILDDSAMTTFSRVSAFWIDVIFTFLMAWAMLLTKCFSSLLPFANIHCISNNVSLRIVISTVIGAWLDDSLQLGWIWWWLNSGEDGLRNTKSKTKLVLWSLSEYLVGTFSIGLEISKEKESVISKRESLWLEWKGKFEFQEQSLILKSLVIMTIL